MRYFKEKRLEESTTEELRIYLLKYLKDERKLSDRSINYYNSVIRFISEANFDDVMIGSLKLFGIHKNSIEETLQYFKEQGQEMTRDQLIYGTFMGVATQDEALKQFGYTDLRTMPKGNGCNQLKISDGEKEIILQANVDSYCRATHEDEYYKYELQYDETMGYQITVKDKTLTQYRTK